MSTDEKHKSVESEILEELAKFDKPVEHSDDRPPIILKISDDQMKAIVNIIPPMNSKEEITKESLYVFLKENNIVSGIDEEGVEEIFSYGSFNVDVTIAKGKLPINGENAKIEFKFDITGKQKVKLETDATGKVDLRDLHTITNSKAGDILAVKMPATSGENGMTVTGAEISAKIGDDVLLPLGSNVEASADGLSVIASIEGQPIFKDGKISISQVYEVKGDVDFSTGSIKFKGSVIVTGNVLDNFTVDAADTIEIQGNVDKAFIMAGGDVVVKGGLYGQKEGKIKTEGSVTIRSIESGIIEAGKSINILQDARHSTIIAGEDINLENSKGSIVGGKCTLGKNMNVANLGSSSFTETIVEIGISPKIKEVRSQITQKISEHTTQLDKIMLTLKNLKELQKKGPLSPDKVETMKKLVPLANQLKATLETEKSKLNFVDQKIKSTQAGKVRVNGKVYPGVKIFSLSSRLDVKNEINHSSFSEQNEQIVVGPY